MENPQEDLQLLRFFCHLKRENLVRDKEEFLRGKLDEKRDRDQREKVCVCGQKVYLVL